MLLASPCPRQTSRASTLMILRSRRSRSIAPLPFQLPPPKWAGSVVGHLSIFSRTFATCFIPPVLHPSSVARRLYFPIARSPSPSSSLEAGRLHLAPGQRGCSPLSARYRSIASQSKRTSGRNEHAVAPKLPQHSAEKAQVCGKAYYSTATST